jgi:hypothetical protein
MTSSELLIWGIAIHLVVDWLLQNRWIAENKQQLSHPAGYVHATIHAVALLPVFPPLGAAALGVTHFVIDTRRPLAAWSRVMSQPDEGPIADVVHVWRDQALHVLAIIVAALACS